MPKKRNKKRIVLRFLSYFIFFVIMDVLQSRYRSFRGASPYTWVEILEDLGMILLFSLLGTVIMFFKTED